ncbi:hypothetical protein ElyMa_006624900 [Elysia marginata]|uniref:Uncharacterized protein n=1 Tax=Elysia marginata TaxID=1093978 RepID=A0AAV4IIN1_9GAST|nr:hypothetical protein ElyMa_006624900 [Elysia marginata]
MSCGSSHAAYLQYGCRALVIACKGQESESFLSPSTSAGFGSSPGNVFVMDSQQANFESAKGACMFEESQPSVDELLLA